MQEAWVQSLGWEDPRRRKWQPTPAFLPGKCHRQRSLAGYSPWGGEELDTSKRLTHTHTHTHTRSKMDDKQSSSQKVFTVPDETHIFNSIR